jgi:nitroreductase
MNEVMDAIVSRRSVRSFSDEEVSANAVSSILKAGLYAPSACNRQPLFIVGLASKDKVKAFKDLLDGGKEFYGASAIIVIFKRSDDHLAELDCGAAMENMLLAAESLGLSGCWIHCLRDKMNTPENQDKIAKLLNFKSKHEAMEAIALGYRKGDKPLSKPRNMQGDNVL